MNNIFDRKLVPSSEAIASPVGDETVILHLKNGTYFGLDAIGTRIWELLREGQHPAAICSRLADEYDVAPDVVEEDVGRLLTEMKANEIVAETGRTDD